MLRHPTGSRSIFVLAPFAPGMRIGVCSQPFFNYLRGDDFWSLIAESNAYRGMTGVKQKSLQIPPGEGQRERQVAQPQSPASNGSR